METTCQRCHGLGRYEEKLLNLGTLDLEWHIVHCFVCEGKGYINRGDQLRYLRSLGINVRRV